MQLSVPFCCNQYSAKILLFKQKKIIMCTDNLNASCFYVNFTRKLTVFIAHRLDQKIAKMPKKQ